MLDKFKNMIHVLKHFIKLCFHDTSLSEIEISMETIRKGYLMKTFSEAWR